MDAMADEHAMVEETEILGQNGSAHIDTKLNSRNDDDNGGGRGFTV
jgi:hypothetical protein